MSRHHPTASYSSTNSSNFSYDYKISFDQSKLAQHFQQSQEQISFIKMKLTQAYEKLQQQIRANSQLQNQNDKLSQRVRELQEMSGYEKKENLKLKQTLEVILKNRRMMQQQVQHRLISQMEELKVGQKRKNQEKDKQMEELAAELSKKDLKIADMKREMEDKLEKNRMQYKAQEQAQRERYEQQVKRYQLQQQKYQEQLQDYKMKVHAMQMEMGRVASEKYAETTRLRQQIKYYQRSTSPMEYQPTSYQPQYQPQYQPPPPSYSPQFFQPYVPPQFYPMPERQSKEVSSKSMTHSGNRSSRRQYYREREDDNNKQNSQSILNSQIQVNSLNQYNTLEDSIGKWKKSTPSSTSHNTGESMLNDVGGSSCIISNASNTSQIQNDDQLLTSYQMKRKQIEHELNQLDKIKRPTPQDRQKIDRLEKQMYSIDSNIAGLKRKIRRKY